jgi:hypothetical protein
LPSFNFHVPICGLCAKHVTAPAIHNARLNKTVLALIAFSPVQMIFDAGSQQGRNYTPPHISGAHRFVQAFAGPPAFAVSVQTPASSPASLVPRKG